MAVKGNPQTFRGGTVTITPITSNLTPVANATAVPLIIQEGSISGEIAVDEASTNTAGVLLAYGNAKTSIDLSTLVSQSNLTTPFSNGTAWNFKRGDLLTANITSGSLQVVGTFMVTGYDSSLDNEKKTNMDFKLQNHGDLTTENVSIVTN